MKKVLSVIMAVVIAGFMATGCSKGYETKKQTGDVNVSLAASRYPLVKGDNSLTVKIADMSGKAVTDARVDVRYYMPAMPGMAPMEYSTPATMAGTAYTFNANIPMEGGWRVDVSATRGGAALPTVTFNVDAR